MSRKIDEKRINEIRNNPPRQMNAQEAAIYVGISERSLWKYKADQEVAYIKLGKRILFRLSDLDKFIDQNMRVS